ncbi:MAG: serine/threonine-protein kinase [Planctomycetota bacterium]
MEHDPIAPSPSAPPVDLESTARRGDSRTNDDSLLSGATDDFGLARVPAAGDPLLGAEVGGVRIVRFIGEGGMGRVYEGWQARPARRVAVKFVRPEAVSARSARRFDREADVLASLDHPGIARVHAAGIHDPGTVGSLPYMILEFVADGRPITEWCRDRQLDDRSRVDLLLQVCDAVAHAHERGVVHRDLKPGNVLVDAAGRPKVLDFGVAAWLDPAMATISIPGGVVGTPAYMSPEQREGRPVDGRADVYSLGVLAAELLTGESPARAQAAVAARRDRLARTLQRCLEIDAERRYPSVQALAVDLARSLRASAVPRRLLLWLLLVAEIVVVVLLLRGRSAPPVSEPVLGPPTAGSTAPAPGP